MKKLIHMSKILLTEYVDELSKLETIDADKLNGDELRVFVRKAHQCTTQIELLKRSIQNMESIINNKPIIL